MRIAWRAFWNWVARLIRVIDNTTIALERGSEVLVAEADAMLASYKETEDKDLA